MDTIRIPYLPEAEYIRLDLYPATILGRDNTPLDPVLPDGDLRIIATDRYVVILHDTNSGPGVYTSIPIEEYLGRSADKKSHDFISPGGYLLKIVRQQSCGCGSRLRGASIYPGVPRMIR